MRFSEKCVDIALSQFNNNSNVVICAPRQINGFTKREIFDSSWRVPTYFDYVLSPLFIIGSIYKRFNKKKESQYGYVDCVPGAFLLIDISRFLEIGGYDEKVFLYCEESILGFRAKAHGLKTILIKDAAYEHFHSTSIKKTIGKVLNQKRLLFSSRMYYLEHYLKIGRLRRIIARASFRMALIEEWLWRHVVRR